MRTIRDHSIPRHRRLLKISCEVIEILRFLTAVQICAVASIILTEQFAHASEWQYVKGEIDTPFSQPVFRSLTLSADPPEDLVVDVPPRGMRRGYAQWHYGTEDSTRVTLLIDQLGAGEYDLYADLNRDRAIHADETIRGAGRTRLFELPVELVEGFAKTYAPRHVTVRLAATGKSLAVATAGFVEGMVHLDGRPVLARVVDGDGNGFFTDARDRLWFDLDGDAEWDAISEQFPFLPIVRVAERRFAVRADRLGTRLDLDAVEGEGTVRLEIADLAAPSKIARLEVMLFGDDNSAYSISGFEPAQLPVGQYTLGSVSLSIQDGKAARPWVFVFSRSGDRESRRWHRVHKDEQLVLDPVGALRLELNVTDRAKGRHPGQTVTMTPRLYTSDDLLINSCSFGEVDLYSAQDQYNPALLELRAPDGQLLDRIPSGYS